MLVEILNDALEKGICYTRGMRSEEKVFVVGVGPGELPFMSAHGAMLAARAGRVLVDAAVSQTVQDYVKAQCAAELKADADFLKAVSPEQTDLAAELSQSKGDIVYFKRVEEWGALPCCCQVKLPAGYQTILEPLPLLAEGDHLVLIEAGQAVRLQCHGALGHTLKKKKRGLSGQRVVVTRARTQSEGFARLLAERGAKAIAVPAIRIEPHSDRESIVDAIAGLNGYDWVIFSSANGVDMFFTLFFRRFKDMRDFGGARIAAVGPATAARLEELRLQVDVMPKVFTGKEVAKAIDKFDALENRRILLIRPEKGSEDLPKTLEDMGAIVDDIPFYCTVSEQPEVMENAVFRNEGADWLTFCSPSAVKHFHAQYDLNKIKDQFAGMKIVSIGPETTKAIRELGLEETVEAEPHTVPGMIEAMERYEDERRGF